MILKDLVNYLDTIAPAHLQEDYDNSGLQIGNSDEQVSAALICLDVTEEVVDEAITEECDLIISHHPLIFRGIRSLTGNTNVERSILKAIKNDVAIMAMHTNLDNIARGVNHKIAQKLGLINTQILKPKSGYLKKIYTFVPKTHAEEVRKALFEAGAGHIGDYSESSFSIEGIGTFKGGDETSPYLGKKGEIHREAEEKIETIFPGNKQKQILDALMKAHPYEEVAFDLISLENTNPGIGSGMIGELQTPTNEKTFLNHIKKVMNAEGIRYTNLRGKKIRTVAVCGGSGSFLLEEAIRQKADIFISADFKYHQLFDADNKIIIADIGHFESEQYTIELIEELISEKFPNFAVRFSKVNTNPINYL